MADSSGWGVRPKQGADYVDSQDKDRLGSALLKKNVSCRRQTTLRSAKVSKEDKCTAEMTPKNSCGVGVDCTRFNSGCGKCLFVGTSPAHLVQSREFKQTTALSCNAYLTYASPVSSMRHHLSYFNTEPVQNPSNHRNM